jgi:hypothetical protein
MSYHSTIRSQGILCLFLSPDLRRLRIYEAEMLIEELQENSSAERLKDSIRLDKLQILIVQHVEPKHLAFIADHLPSLVVLAVGLNVILPPDFSETSTRSALLEGILVVEYSST